MNNGSGLGSVSPGDRVCYPGRLTPLRAPISRHWPAAGSVGPFRCCGLSCALLLRPALRCSCSFLRPVLPPARRLWSLPGAHVFWHWEEQEWRPLVGALSVWLALSWVLAPVVAAVWGSFFLTGSLLPPLATPTPVLPRSDIWGANTAFGLAVACAVVLLSPSLPHAPQCAMQIATGENALLRLARRGQPWWRSLCLRPFSCVASLVLFSCRLSLAAACFASSGRVASLRPLLRCWVFPVSCDHWCGDCGACAVVFCWRSCCCLYGLFVVASVLLVLAAVMVAVSVAAPSALAPFARCP